MRNWHNGKHSCVRKPQARRCSRGARGRAPSHVDARGPPPSNRRAEPRVSPSPTAEAEVEGAAPRVRAPGLQCRPDSRRRNRRLRVRRVRVKKHLCHRVLLFFSFLFCTDAVALFCADQRHPRKQTKRLAQTVARSGETSVVGCFVQWSLFLGYRVVVESSGTADYDTPVRLGEVVVKG